MRPLTKNYEETTFRAYRFACGGFLSGGFRAGKIHDPAISFDSFGGFAKPRARRQTAFLSDERDGNFAGLDDRSAGGRAETNHELR